MTGTIGRQATSPWTWQESLGFVFAAQEMLTERLAAAGARPVATLLGVSRLAFPPLLVEIEATAVV